MSRQWTKLLMQPFYPGMGNRGTVQCAALPEMPPKNASPEFCEEADREKRAWQDYFDGIGPKPDANTGNS